MKVTRTCIVCGQKKTKSVGKFTKVKNIVKRIPDRMKNHFDNLKLNDYVCSGCLTSVERLKEE